MRYPQSFPDIAGEFTRDMAQLDAIHTGAMQDLVGGFVDELREQTRTAGLGERAAKTWRGKVYPTGRASKDPAGYVWSKFPKVMLAYAQGATIVPLDGRRYLAIPTRNVPLKGRGRRMTPLDVEVAFNQDLIIRPSRAGRLLAFVNVVAGRNGRGVRQATKGRVAQGRKPKLVLMFVLVRAVRVARRIDPDAAYARWAGRFDALVQLRWDASDLGRAR